MPILKPSKTLLDICARLGCNYQVTTIDHENVIYRKLNDSYDFEISRLDTNSKSISATVYIWAIKEHNQIVETISNIKSFVDLQNVLNEKSNYYSNKIL